MWSQNTGSLAHCSTSNSFTSSITPTLNKGPVSGRLSGKQCTKRASIQVNAALGSSLATNQVFSSPLKLNSGKRTSVVAQATGNLTRLPIFPLGCVALPSANTPLQIFEARYRVLFSTLLAGLDGIDDGLISPDKPWKGTRRFGMAYFDQQAGGLAAIGTVLEITEHSLLEDGRLMINTIGRERFKIENVVEERPVLVCDVEFLPEDNDTSDTATKLAEEVADLFRNVVRLSVKLRDAPVPPELSDPSQLTTLPPKELSFWVASLFAGNPYNQQALLEEESTMSRLQTEQELLSSTLKYLSAQAALQSAFGSSSSTSSPDGGEDIPSR